MPRVPDGRVSPYEPERRRYPRRAASATTKSRMSADAEVLDLSLGGALIRCDYPLQVGDRAQIRTMLNRQPFVAWVSVVRIAAEYSEGSSRPSFGVVFLGKDEQNAALLQRFLRRTN
jgi:hypothetical protein